jgi:nucleoside-diphosphate-sugar epimerase
MKVLLTGANGFLGKTILEKLLINNHIVLSLSRTSGDYKIALEREIPTFDLNFDLVIHAAGKAHNYPKSEVIIQEFYDINVIGTRNLLKGLEKNILPRQLLFVSSVAVYGIESGISITEDCALLARDPYGLSKIQAENLVTEWSKKHNVICTILRLPLVVGVNPPGNLGSMIDGIMRGYYFNICGGIAKKSMVLVNDVANHVLKAAEVGGIYNLTDGYHPTISEISHLISKELKKKPPYNLPLWLAKFAAKIGNLFGNKAPINTFKLNKIISELTFNDNKAKLSFGWKPTFVLEGFKFIDKNK